MLHHVLLAMDDASQALELERELKACGMLVQRLKTPVEAYELTEAPQDIVVFSAEAVGGRVADALGLLRDLPDPPTVVLLDHARAGDQAATRLAQGCDAVLDPAASPASIAAAIAAMATRRDELTRASGGVAATTEAAGPSLADFASRSMAMQELQRLARRVAGSHSSLLITGETGVGKEHLALGIHAESPRASGPFVAINCAALPETLLESELFGHVRGAFTGATRTRRGAFEMAHGGTLFLDEIGDLPLPLQSKLLRVLQSRSFTKLGAEQPIKVDVRIMAATNRDLEAAIETRSFRRDLYYRLGVVNLHIPPLRERMDDLPELVTNYLGYLAPRVGASVTGITTRALEALTTYAWPGNVRELINVIERAMLITDGETITLDDLPMAISGQPPKAGPSIGPPDIPPADLLAKPWKKARAEALASFEKSYLTALMIRAHGRLVDAAHLAGFTERALHDKLKTHGLRKESFRLRATNP